MASEADADALFSGQTFAAGNNPRSVAVADLDGDTIPDLVTANSTSDDVSVLLGNGDGTFQTAVSFAAGNGPYSVAVADLNGDTMPDLVTANVNSGDVSVLLNLTAPPTECEFIGSLPRSTVMLAAFQDNTCENWSGISQPGEDLQSAVLTKADLSFSNLNGTVLANATLIGANLNGASLFNVNMSSANLDSAILTNADLSFANLDDANLVNADLTGADLSSANLTGALYDEFTIFPSGNTYDIPPWGLDGGISPWNAGMIPTPEPSLGLMLLFGSGALAGFASRRR